MKLAFFGTSDFAIPTLQACVKAGHQIVAVVTQPDRPSGRGRELRLGPVKRTAVEYGLEVLQPERVKAPEFQESFKQYSPLDAAVCAAFGQIIPQWLLDFPRLGFLNVHPSLLPKYRGAAPIQRAIMTGETVTGVTIMLMDAGLDTGPILIQCEVPIEPEEDADSLAPRLAELGGEMVMKALLGLEKGEIKPQPQDDTKATYARMLGPEDSVINWEMPAVAIVNQIRGVTPKPGAHTTIGKTALKVWHARVCDPTAKVIPGALLSIRDEGIEISAGRGSVILIAVQPENRKQMTAAEFARGARLKNAI